MTTIYDMPDLGTYCKFLDCDVHTAKIMREFDVRDANEEKMAACKAADAEWRAEREAKRATLQSVTNPLYRWVLGVFL